MPQRRLTQSLTFMTLAPMAALLALVYGLHRWEWGLADDMLMVTRGIDFTSRFGVWRGIVESALDFMHGDRVWGLFRPSWWVYQATVYQLSPNLAYFMRFLTFAGIYVFSVLLVLRAASAAGRGVAPWLLYLLVAMLASIHPFFDCLSFIPQQEYCGLVLVSGALALSARGQEKWRDWAAAALMLLAAWFKTPFIWLLLAFGVLAAVKRKRAGLGALCVLVAAADIVIAGRWARTGTYTSKITHLDPALFLRTLTSFGKEFAAPALVTLAAQAVGLRQKLSLRPRPYDGYGLALVFAGGMYLASLLPWGAATYYVGAPAYLLCLGVFVLLAPRWETAGLPREAGRRALVTASLAATVVVASHGLWKVVARDLTVQGMRDWALAQPHEGVLWATNGPESFKRFEQLLGLRSGGSWKNRFMWLPDATPAGAHENGPDSPDRITYYIVFSDQGSGNKAYMNEPVARFPMATIYKVR